MTTGIITVIAIFGCFYIFRRIFPYRPNDFPLQKSPEELRKLYGKFETRMIFFIFFLMFFNAFLVTMILVLISNFRYSFLPDALFTVKPEVAFWGIIGLLIGIVSAGFVGNKLTDLILKNNAAEYKAYYNSRYGFDAWRILDLMTKGVLALTAPFILLGFDWYSQFNQNEILFNKFWGFGTVQYKVKQIENIKLVNSFKAPNGEIREEEHFVIYFNDDKKWNSLDNGFREIEKDYEIIEFLLEKTGKPLEEIEIE